MAARGYSEAFARQIFQQILGFGEYGFPESHAASFALLTYVSSWLKCHEPAAFTAALLNAQPMGFYAPSQLVQDARRHGVKVREVDVTASDWDCTLEGKVVGENGVRVADSDPIFPPPALRLGLRLVKGLPRAGAERLLTARSCAPFRDAADLSRRAGLARRDMEALAAAGALERLAGDRHQARWACAGVEPPLPLFDETAVAEPVPELPVPTEGQNIVADYASLGLTLGRHPLALLRPRLTGMGLRSAEQVRLHAHGDPVRIAGLVTCRQCPSSSAGVIFVTLEDETGTTQIIVWPRLAERQRRILTAAGLLAVTGEVQREGEVLHVIAHRLEDHSALLGGLVARSRDFQ